MDTRFARLNIQLSQAPADIDAFNKIHRCIVERPYIPRPALNKAA